MDSTDTASATVTELAVAVGRVESTVGHILTNTERRLDNGEKFQVSAQAEFSDIHGRISTVEASLNTSVKWILALITVMGIAVGVIMSIVK